MKLLKQFLGFGAVAFLSRIISFVTFPILANNFTVSEYGELDFLSSLVSLAAIASCFGTDSAVGRCLSYTNSEREVSKIIFNGAIINIMFLGIIFMPIYFYCAYYSSVKLDRMSSIGLVSCVIAQVAFNFKLNILKWTKEYRDYRITSILNIVFHTLLIVIIVDRFEINVAEYLLLTSVCIMSSAALKFNIVLKRIDLRNYSNGVIKEIIINGAPYGIVSLLGVLMPMVERHILLERFGTHELGLYAITAKFASIIMVLASAYQVAWGPEVMSRLSRRNEKNFYLENSNFITYTLIVVLVLINAILPIVFEVLNLQKFNAAISLFIPMASCVLLNNFSKIVDVGIAASNSVHVSLYPYVPIILVYFTLVLKKEWNLEIHEIIYIIAFGCLFKYAITLIAAYRLTGHKLGGFSPVIYLISMVVIFYILGNYNLMNGNQIVLVTVLLLIFPVVMMLKSMKRSF